MPMIDQLAYQFTADAVVGDITNRISRDYGCLLEEKGITTRATYIIEPKDIIQFMGIHNLNVGWDTKEILWVLQSLQTGELCAAGWKKGNKHNSK